MRATNLVRNTCAIWTRHSTRCVDPLNTVAHLDLLIIGEQLFKYGLSRIKIRFQFVTVRVIRLLSVHGKIKRQLWWLVTCHSHRSHLRVLLQEGLIDLVLIIGCDMFCFCQQSVCSRLVLLRVVFCEHHAY